MSEYDDKQVRANGLTEREEETLGIWTQERLSELREKVATLKRENNALREESDHPTEASSVAYGDVENDPHYLPDSMTDAVRYYLDEGHIDVRLKGASLELAGSEDLKFVPQATNVIRIQLDD